MTAVDYSFARPTPAELKAAGVTAVGRYLTGAGKAISAHELNELSAEGIAVWLTFEVGADDVDGGLPAGTRNAELANQALTRLGLPIDTPVYFTADKELENATLGEPYFEGLADIRPSSVNGAYGEGALLEDLRSTRLAAYYWLSSSTSFPGSATPQPWQQIVQKASGAPLPDTDLDVIQAADFGQWPRPEAPSVPEGGEGMIAKDPKTGGYWVVRPSGAVYGFQGASNLGPGAVHQEEWQIGPGKAVGPIVGIAADGEGGYVLAADNGAYPGTPALYHLEMPANGNPADAPYLS